MTRGVLFLAVLAVAGCSQDPGASLIEPPRRDRLAVAPASVPAVNPDGFPNVLVEPAPVPGRYREPDVVAAQEASLAARGRSVNAAAAGALSGGSIAGDLRRRAATHVDEATREIEAGGRPSAGDAAGS